MDDKPGGFSSALKCITDAGISVKYMYACMSHKAGRAIMILSVSDTQKAEDMVKNAEGDMEQPSSIYRISEKNK